MVPYRRPNRFYQQFVAPHTKEMPKRDVRSGNSCHLQWGSSIKQTYKCGNARSRAIADTKINRRIAAVYAKKNK